MTATSTTSTNILTEALDVLENINFSQIGDALSAAVKSPVTGVEDLANVLLQAGAVAGVPFASTAEAMLPVAESLFGFITSLLPVTSPTQAASAAAISSPPVLQITATPIPVAVSSGQWLGAPRAI